MVDSGFVHSIETFGTVDGPGIRFVLFLQGCLMRCQYCHNPDTWKMNTGTKMNVSYILDEYEKYRPFLKGGGITVSGGEPLLQIEFLISLFKEAKARNIHTCLDTCGGVYRPNDEKQHELLKELMQYTDLVMLDIKHIQNEEHVKLTGMENTHVLLFAQFLDTIGQALRIRHVVIPTITLNDKYLYQLGYFLGRLYHIESLEVLPYHLLGRSKWEQLGKEYPLEGIREATKDEASRARLVILKGMQDYKKTV